MAALRDPRPDIRPDMDPRSDVPSAPGPTSPIRILLVDDNRELRCVLRKILVRAGYAVTEAGHGREALKLHKLQPADLILTDLIMPEMEGIETILELKRLQPGVKVIAMSGGGRVNASDYLNLAAALGAARTLSKPFSESELLDAVRDVTTPA